MNEEGDTFVVIVISQVTITNDEDLLSWKWLNVCLPIESSEWISQLVHVTLFLLINFLTHKLSHCFLLTIMSSLIIFMTFQ